VASEGLELSELLGLGAGIAALLAVGMALGWGLDKLAGTSPIFVVVGLALGVVGACAYTVVEFRKFLSTSETDEGPRDEGSR
jgi:F0F1-type ATP synthase assembly protein I